jgi:FkbM family methyltransferase
MTRLKELALRFANAAMIKALAWIHGRYEHPPTYRIGKDGTAAQFEGAWFVYDASAYGATGNIDYIPDAENQTRTELFARIKDGEVFYDIGAHGGVYTITLARRFPRLAVHSFEPQPEELLENLKINDLAISNVHAVALGEHAGVVMMTTKNRSSNHVNDQGDREVSLVRLDQYVKEHSLELPNWIKIDIEGLELPALRGAENILRASKPTIIAEINHLSGRYGSTIPDFLTYMRSLGFEVHSLANGKLEPIFGDVLPYSANWNYWFLPR